MQNTASIGRTVALQGMEMYFESHGDGEPLLLLHGFTGSSQDWAPLVGSLLPGHRLIIPDLRGHGRSSNPSGQFTFRQSGLDVLALLDHLGLERVRAIGLSAGAKTLLHVATRQPERLEAMVLVSGTTCFPAQARTLMGMMSPDHQPESEWEVMRQRHRLGDDQIRALWRQGNAFKDSYDDMTFTAPWLSTIQARTLIVHGDRDPFYPVSIALEMYTAIPRAWLWVVPNGGHGPIGGDIQGFLKTSREFLRGDWEQPG